jgi:hypothetical protein
MLDQPKWGTVNLGVDVLQGHGEQSQPGKNDYNRLHPRDTGKQQYNPARNQELKLPVDMFRMHKFNDENPFSPSGEINRAGVHERIKELLGEGKSKREAVLRARHEMQGMDRGDVGTITPKDVYRSKYQSPTPSKQISPLTTQVQEYPYL